MEKTYKGYIANYIKKKQTGIPIYTQQVAHAVAEQYGIEINQAKKVVNVTMKRLMEDGMIDRFQKGVYYKTKQTPFGKTKLNPDFIVMDRYLEQKGQVIGYETDDTFMNKLGLTTQLPKYRYIATNYYKNNGYLKNDNFFIALRKPKTTVTTENYKYLQILDVLENRNNTPIDTRNPNRLILNYLKDSDIDFTKLIALAGKYYKEDVLKGIAKIAQEEVNEPAFR